MTNPEWSVKVEGSGPAGPAYYREGAHALELYWEYGGGDVLMIISGPAPQDWDRELPWAISRREEIMGRVAHHFIGRRTRRYVARFGDDFTTVEIARRRRDAAP